MASSGTTHAELNPQLEKLLAELLPEELRQPGGFERWFQPLKRSVTAAVNAVHGDVQQSLGDERRSVLEEEGCGRDLWVTTGEDPRWLVKSISSLRSKVARELRQRQENGGLPTRWRPVFFSVTSPWRKPSTWSMNRRRATGKHSSNTKGANNDRRQDSAPFHLHP